MVAHRHAADAPNLAAPKPAEHHPVELAALNTAAAHPVVTPTNEKHPDAANVEGPLQTQTQCPIFEQPTDNEKRFAALWAHLALTGRSLHRTAADDGSVCFYVTRWGVTRELPAAAQFPVQLGGRHG